MASSLRPNAFTEAGYDELDNVVADTLKRGRNGLGYEVSFDYCGPNGVVCEATLSHEEKVAIRRVMELGGEPSEGVVAVAAIMNEAHLRAKRD